MLTKTTPTGIRTKTRQLVHPSVRWAERTGARDREWSAELQTPALPPQSWSRSSCSTLQHRAITKANPTHSEATGRAKGGSGVAKQLD